MNSLSFVANHEELVPLGTFWSGEWHATSHHLHAKTKGRDRLEMLRVSTYATGQLLTTQTLHSLAVTVLTDAGLTPSEYWVDPALQSLVIPWVWFGTVSHREALRQIAEAALGQVYVDRNGIIRVEGATSLSPNAPGLTITADQYFHKDTPVKWGELANRIEVETQPLSPVGVAEEVYRSNEPVPILAGQTLTVSVFYNNPPVIDAVASLVNPPVGKTITGATYYAWGADVTVHSTTTSSFTLSISGRPLIVQNRNRISVQDADSIRDNGLLRYSYPVNHLVQTRAHAQFIADTLLNLYRHARRDLTMDWRGNPALLLGNIVTTQAHGETLRYWVVKQEVTFDGGLRADIEGRLVR